MKQSYTAKASKLDVLFFILKIFYFFLDKDIKADPSTALRSG